MGRKNTFSRAISQLKSTEVDEKLELIEAIPTNNTAGLMTIGDPTVMVPGVDDQYTELDFNKDNDADDGKNTSGIFAEDGTILTREPDVGDTSYILGPMASMWYGWGNFSTFGYIRESDRKMVNLGTISGKLSDWDQETGFTSYGQLTIEQAKWFYGVEKKDKSGNDPDNANYRAFYPGPPSNVPDAFGRYLCTITGQPKVFGPPITPDTWTPPEQGSMDADSNFSLQHGRSDDLAWGGKPKGPPTKKFGGIRGRTAETDAMMSVNGMGLSPEAFEKKYGISPQEYINLPHSQSSAGGDTQIAYGGYSIEDKKNVINLSLIHI